MRHPCTYVGPLLLAACAEPSPSPGNTVPPVQAASSHAGPMPLQTAPAVALPTPAAPAGNHDAAAPWGAPSPTDVVRRLLDEHVPEIREGIVAVRALTRVPGRRTKVALSSSDPDVDPIGAAVGIKGTRIRAVVQALAGEPIDLVPWDAEPTRFVTAAVAPTQVLRILVDDDAHAMVLVVPDPELARLRDVHLPFAATLTGWTLEVLDQTTHARQGWDAPPVATARP